MIEAAIAELNQRPHAYFSKYTREQVDLYIESIDTRDDVPWLYKEDTSEASIVKVQTSLALDKVHHMLTAGDRGFGMANRYHTTELDLFTLSGQEELRQLVTAGFSITLAQNNLILKQQNELKGKQDEFAELQRSYNCTIEELQAQLSELKKVQDARREKQLRFSRRIRREVNMPIELEHYLFALGVVGDKPAFCDARLRLALTLLFLTGLKVGEVLQVETNSVKDLFEKQKGLGHFGQ